MKPKFFQFLLLVLMLGLVSCDVEKLFSAPDLPESLKNSLGVRALLESNDFVFSSSLDDQNNVQTAVRVDVEITAKDPAASSSVFFRWVSPIDGSIDTTAVYPINGTTTITLTKEGYHSDILELHAVSSLTGLGKLIHEFPIIEDEAYPDVANTFFAVDYLNSDLANNSLLGTLHIMVPDDHEGDFNADSFTVKMGRTNVNGFILDPSTDITADVTSTLQNTSAVKLNLSIDITGHDKPSELGLAVYTKFGGITSRVASVAPFWLIKPNATFGFQGFTDREAEAGKLSGILSLGRAQSEVETVQGLKSFVIKWASATAELGDLTELILATSSCSNGFTCTVSADSANITLNSVAIPTNADRLKIYGKHSENVLSENFFDYIFEDLRFPTQTATLKSFTDVDPGSSHIAGSLEFSAPSDESNIDRYNVYLNTETTSLSEFSRLAGSVNKGSSPYTFNFPRYTSALYLNGNGNNVAYSHVCVQSAKAFVGKADAVSCTKLNNEGVPQTASGGLSFVDENPTDKLTGKLILQRAGVYYETVDNVQKYHLHWGKSDNTVNSAHPAVLLTGNTNGTCSSSFGDCNYNSGTRSFEVVLNDVSLPSAIDRFLAFAVRNDDSTPPVLFQSPSPSISVISNFTLPTFKPGATTFTFTDTNAKAGLIEGVLTFSAASTETENYHEKIQYRIYLSETDAANSLRRNLGYVTANGSDSYPFTVQNATSVRFEYNETAKSWKAYGFLCVSTVFRGHESDGSRKCKAFDDVGAVQAVPGGLTFTDGNSAAGKLGGSLVLTRASEYSEADDAITRYVVRWGGGVSSVLASDSVFKTTVDFGTSTCAGVWKTCVFDAASRSVSITLANVSIPQGATHFLAHAAAGSSTFVPSAFGVGAAIVDLGLPGVPGAPTFVDGNDKAGRISGTVSFAPSSSEGALTGGTLRYRVFLREPSSDARNYLALIAADGRTGVYNHSIPEGTSSRHSFKNGAWVDYTKMCVTGANEGGEGTPACSDMTDDGKPQAIPGGLAFIDGNTSSTTIEGVITLIRSALYSEYQDEITGYVIYWGSSATSKLAGSAAIVTISLNATCSTGFTCAAGAGIFSISPNAALTVPNGATHLLAYAVSGSDEAASGTFLEFVNE